MKEQVSEYVETKPEIDLLAFRLRTNFNVMKILIKNAREFVNNCNRSGSVVGQKSYLESIANNISTTQQNIIRESNKLRKLIKTFEELNVKTD
jgi:hypothetical protein